MSEKNDTIRLLLDIPEEEVIFGFEEYASALTSAILGTEPQFTIGILGNWGSGKTTLLRKIGNILKSEYYEQVLTVFFDAWRYQSEENMLLPILDTISEQLKKETGNWGKLNDGIKRLTKSIAVATTLGMYGVNLDVEKGINEWNSSEQTRSDYFNWFNELKDMLSETIHDDPKRRIVVLIDDLDRCVPNKLVEVLESIKTMLDVPGFVFVLALDKIIAERAIESVYGQNQEVNGQDYIKKLIQVEFRLPPLRKQDVIQYTGVLQQRITNVDVELFDTLSEVVPMVAGDNPREVKRFINSVLLATSMMKRVGVTVSVKNQVAFMALQAGWPGVAINLANNNSNRKLFKEYFEAKLNNTKSSLSDSDRKSIEETVENNIDLDSFFENSKGRELLDLIDSDFSELVYYSTITREKKAFEEAEDLIEDVLLTLTPREHRVINLRYGIEDGNARTLQDVGTEFHVTRERIRQIMAKSLRKLRHPSRSRKLKHLLSSMDELSDSSQSLMLDIFGHRVNE